MNFLISFCLNNRITVILLTIALAIISIFVVKNIPVDVFPEPVSYTHLTLPTT